MDKKIARSKNSSSSSFLFLLRRIDSEVINDDGGIRYVLYFWDILKLLVRHFEKVRFMFELIPRFCLWTSIRAECGWMLMSDYCNGCKWKV